jgi:AcrR family transcriptional regulator
MPRPKTITDDRVLEAARALFLERGVSASTAEIARRAGISEGSIFKRFPTKEALFDAALQTPPVPEWALRLETLVGEGDPYENLVRTLRALIVFLQRILPMVMVAFGGKPGPQPALSSGVEPPHIRDRRLLARYLRREMDAGRLREADADAVAQLLVGTATSFVMDRLLMDQTPTPDDVDRFVLGVADVVWRGLSPE